MSLFLRCSFTARAPFLLCRLCPEGVAVLAVLAVLAVVVLVLDLQPWAFSSISWFE